MILLNSDIHASNFDIYIRKKHFFEFLDLKKLRL